MPSVLLGIENLHMKIPSNENSKIFKNVFISFSIKIENVDVMWSNVDVMWMLCRTLWSNVDVLWSNVDVMWTLHISTFHNLSKSPSLLGQSS